MSKEFLRVVLALTVVTLSACEPMLGSSQQPEQMAAESSARLHGWIQSKREIAPLNADARAPASYEYTARMRDGSSHVFREEMPVSWRLGERLIVIVGSERSTHRTGP